MELDNKVDIPNCLVHFYLAEYYLSKGINFNIEKYNRILTVYYSLLGYFICYWPYVNNTDLIPKTIMRNINNILRE